ncbi:MAG: hypothetical protein Q7T18_03890, partial [Sedimentisphaerales bacterium]|nr:hypothetical protein [Sedimentisphaerales bacterium]
RNLSPVSLNLVSHRDARIEAFFVTDESHDCASMKVGHDLRSLAIPAESLITLMLKTGSQVRSKSH